MNECKKCSRLIGKALYDELKSTEAEFFNEHLKTCSDCVKEFEDLKNTLSVFKTQVRQEPDQAFMNDFWDLLEPKLKKKPSSLSIWFTNFVNAISYEITWKHQLAGAVVLIFVGIVVGKYLLNDQGISTQYSNQSSTKSSIEQTAVQIEVVNYIERSKVLMLGLMNFDPATDDVETISLPTQKEISRQLLSKATELKKDLKNPSQQQLKKLVTDIELILLQIANLETKYDLAGIELIKSGVETRGIILKINIQEMKESSRELTIPNNQIKQKEI